MDLGDGNSFNCTCTFVALLVVVYCLIVYVLFVKKRKTSESSFGRGGHGGHGGHGHRHRRNWGWGGGYPIYGPVLERDCPIGYGYDLVSGKCIRLFD